MVGGFDDGSLVPLSPNQSPSQSPRRRFAYVVAPDGQVGGGMGRVKDYILLGAGELPALELRALPTRDDRGAAVSLALTAWAILRIWLGAARGDLAFVHVNFGDRGSAARKSCVIAAAKLVGVPALLHLHAVELEAQWRAGGPWRRRLIAAPFRLATVALVLGERWRRWLVDDLRLPPDRVEVLWNGVPLDAPGVPRAAHEGPVRGLFLGNLMERKGVGDLLAALAALPPSLDWRMTFAGGGDLAHYRATADSLGLSPRLAFTGWVDQPQARVLLADADFLALPSYDEGLPLVILEALGCGAPVLCTPVGAIPEVLRDGETALFCAPGDRAGLTAGLARLIGEPDLRVRLSRAGLALYAARFSLKAFHAALFGVYERRFGCAPAAALDPLRAP